MHVQREREREREIFPNQLLVEPQRGPGFPRELPRGAQGIPRKVRLSEVRGPLGGWMKWLGWLVSMEGPIGYQNLFGY